MKTLKEEAMKTLMETTTVSPFTFHLYIKKRKREKKKEKEQRI